MTRRRVRAPEPRSRDPLRVAFSTAWRSCGEYDQQKVPSGPSSAVEVVEHELTPHRESAHAPRARSNTSSATANAFADDPVATIVGVFAGNRAVPGLPVERISPARMSPARETRDRRAVRRIAQPRHDGTRESSACGAMREPLEIERDAHRVELLRDAQERAHVERAGASRPAARRTGRSGCFAARVGGRGASRARRMGRSRAGACSSR